MQQASSYSPQRTDRHRRRVEMIARFFNRHGLRLNKPLTAENAAIVWEALKPWAERYFVANHGPNVADHVGTALYSVLTNYKPNGSALRTHIVRPIWWALRAEMERYRELPRSGCRPTLSLNDIEMAKLIAPPIRSDLEQIEAAVSLLQRINALPDLLRLAALGRLMTTLPCKTIADLIGADNHDLTLGTLHRELLPVA